MARKPRIEYEGAVYHVVSRGNYRADVFSQERTKAAFIKCLDEAVAKSGWVVHAWCVMSNHYHLCVETPQANLVAGMKWLQSTFSIRFNRLRNERGHIFQGRYKALPVDPDAVGAVCHYIHLNPVRAGVKTLATLVDWPWSSVRWLVHKRERRSWFSAEAFLVHAGGLNDSAADRKRYLEYLGWLQEDETSKKTLRFEQMSKGWAVGESEFKKVLLQMNEEQQAALLLSGDRTFAEELWEEQVKACLSAVPKSEAEVRTEPKGAPWKVAVATTLKNHTTASNPWLSRRLNMGSPFRLSRLVTDCRANSERYEPFIGRCAKCKA
jgi:REP element-mobilizing transposase RayT